MTIPANSDHCPTMLAHGEGNTTNALDHATALARQGIPTFPCLASKRPACPHGFKDATANVEALRELWGRHPGSLVGVPTGPASGFDALDLDVKHAEACAWWAENRNRLPATRAHRTRSDGLHLLFQHMPGLRCSAGKLAPGVDIRADGGYIVWWPAAGLPVLADAGIASWPAWLLAALEASPAPRPALARPVLPTSGDGSRRYAVAALRNAVQRVASAAAGQRNDRLNRECFALGRFIADGSLTASEISDTLAVAAHVAGLPPRETIATLVSALRAGGAA